MSETIRFDEAKARLEEIVSEVRKKDTTLEHSIELLEEGVKLANVCTERIDETYFREEEGLSADIPPEGSDSAADVLE